MMSTPHSSPFQAYSRANHTVAKTRQVVMLYDGAIRFLQQAKVAIEEGDISERYNKLVRAGEIVMGLQSCLDFESGGDAARILFDFYASVDMRIMALHRTNDAVACESVTQDLKDMRDVWDRIDRGAIDASQMKEAAQEVADHSAVAAGSLTVNA